MKTYSAILWATMYVITLSGCGEHIDYGSPEIKDSNRANEYAVAWVKAIGTIPVDQDWCMLTNANISINSAGGSFEASCALPRLGSR